MDSGPLGETDSGSDTDRVLLDVQHQAAATREILEALGRAGADPSGVLDTIIDRAVHLCRAQVAQLYLLDGDTFRLSRISGDAPEEFIRYVEDHPVGRSRDSLLGRVAEDRVTQQIGDVLRDPDYGRHDLQSLAGFRTLMSAPMLLHDEVIGILSVWRTEAQPFDAGEVDVLSAFAVQAAIVLRQVELVAALEARSGELAAKVTQLEVLREIGEAISSTLDLDEVLGRIVSGAVRLCWADGGSIMEYDAAADCFRVRATAGGSPVLTDRLRALTIRRSTSPVGRAAAERSTLVVPDLASAARDDHLDILLADGWRSLLAVPLVRQDQLVGALVIRRRRPGDFGADTPELLRTFANQSGLAIVNARLFGELDTKRAELEVASRHKSEFLASMSHELRTPLNAVIGFSEVLLDRMFGELNPRQEEYLRDIWTSGKHLLELLNEILDLSKVEAGRMVLEPSLVSVRACLDYVLSLVRDRAAAHAIDVGLEVSEDVGIVWADELRLKQVVLNLVSNAVKFTPDGGTVRVFATREGEDVVVRVSDTGVGVPPEDRERIFESFQQGHRAAPNEEGTGLGLTLSRRIVALFGGTLWLEPQAGVGSVFAFRVPLPAVEPVGKADDDGLSTVLLVDDDRASLDLMTAYLSASPVRVLHARDGFEALSLSRTAAPDAVVLDIRLPRMDGWEVLARMKADPATRAIPVVVASIIDERQRGLQLGAVAYLLKPVRRDDLLDALRGHGLELEESEVGSP
ncbi:GAF domain-containing protein [Nocardioides eburneiflavus]|uniref:histidine kinase n=1 Tax=Nocardioides eburneiflavus TaxID=2518372 RepID=A0A4Z1CE33_9ACTN|nr:GAF domain-containing protein [Nocardioides eburneiflavus]TGN64145.1 GAF domain-containing protein [Nocardioides eburneiflavus]